MYECWSLIFMVIHLSGVTVGLEQTSYTVGEGSGTLSVCAVLSGMAQRNVSVTLSTIQGIAQGKYTFLSKYWYMCELMHCISTYS